MEGLGDYIMEYKIQDTKESAIGELVKILGDGQYTIKIDDTEHHVRLLSVDSRGIEFILDNKYHAVKYLESTTASMSLVVDGVPMRLHMHSELDKIVYKNSGGSGSDNSGSSLKSQIPGKVVSVSVTEGESVKKGDPVAVLESMKMQVAVKSHKDGTVRTVKIKKGASVAKNDVIAEID